MRRTRTSVQRYNDRMDKIWADALAAQEKEKQRQMAARLYGYRMFEDGMGPSVEGMLDTRMIGLPEDARLFDREDAISDAQHLLKSSEYMEDFLATLEKLYEDNKAHRPMYADEVKAIKHDVEESEIVRLSDV